jgi:hypothetical protein
MISDLQKRKLDGVTDLRPWATVFDRAEKARAAAK